MVDAGYRCGLAGKWHLGDSLNPVDGFDYWFTKPKGHTSTFFGDDAIWQGKIYQESGYFTDKITEHALNFICLLYTSPSPRDGLLSRMPSSA